MDDENDGSDILRETVAKISGVLHRFRFPFSFFCGVCRCKDKIISSHYPLRRGDHDLSEWWQLVTPLVNEAESLILYEPNHSVCLVQFRWTHLYDFVA